MFSLPSDDVLRAAERFDAGRIYTHREIKSARVLAFTFGMLAGSIFGTAFGVVLAVLLVAVL